MVQSVSLCPEAILLTLLYLHVATVALLSEYGLLASYRTGLFVRYGELP